MMDVEAHFKETTVAKPRNTMLKRRITKRQRNRPEKLRWRVFLRKEVVNYDHRFKNA